MRTFFDTSHRYNKQINYDIDCKIAIKYASTQEELNCCRKYLDTNAREIAKSCSEYGYKDALAVYTLCMEKKPLLLGLIETKEKEISKWNTLNS